LKQMVAASRAGAGKALAVQIEGVLWRLIRRMNVNIGPPGLIQTKKIRGNRGGMMSQRQEPNGDYLTGSGDERRSVTPSLGHKRCLLPGIGLLELTILALGIVPMLL